MAPFVMVVVLIFCFPFLAKNIPSLVYNCARCRPSAKTSTKGHSISSDGLLQHSELLHKRLKNQPPAQELVCPTATWADDHSCPEKNQPLIVLDGATVNDGGFLGEHRNSKSTTEASIPEQRTRPIYWFIGQRRLEEIQGSQIQPHC